VHTLNKNMHLQDMRLNWTNSKYLVFQDHRNRIRNVYTVLF